jgi:hypothetical protein
MPTERRRHMITETAEVSDALADAAARWPGQPPSELLRRLVSEGHAALRASVEAERAAVEQTSGALTGVYQAGELDTLHNEWPA